MEPSGLTERSYAYLIYDELEEYEEILKFIEVELAKAPGNSHLHNNRSVALSEIGRWEEAEEAIRRAIELDSRSPALFQTFARLLRNTDRDNDALEALTRSIELDSSDPYPLRIRAGWLEERKRYEEAIDDLSSAISLDPNFEGSYVNRAKIYEKTGRLDEASADYETARHIAKR